MPTPHLKRLCLLLAVLGLTLLAACDDGGEDPVDTDLTSDTSGGGDTDETDTTVADTTETDTAESDADTSGDDTDATPTMEAISIPFEVRAGTQAFACDTALTGIGSSDAELTPTDMRFYVYDVEVVADDETVVPVTLADDDIWQDGTVALLDFEDGTGNCANGTAEMHTTIDGEVPAGMTWTGLRFKVGVPFELNHADPALAEPPLSYTSMHWNWQGGYKFFRFDSDNGGDGWRVHLGSTGCMGEVGAITGCDRSNRPAAALDGFDPATSTVVLDLATLLGDADVTMNTENTAPGCMGAADDPECAPVFGALGLAIETGEPMGSPSIFTLE